MLPPAALDETAAALRRACRTARDAGVLLALENHADLTAGEIIALLERAGDDLLGVCFDPVNALRVGDDAQVAAALLAPRVRMMHVKDCDAAGGGAAGPRSVPFGTGVVPLAAILETLAVAGLDGPVCVELGQLGPGLVDECALVAQGVDWLRDWRSRPPVARAS